MNGFNKRPCDRSVLVAIDLTAAFDTVNHEKLLNYVNESTLPDTLEQFLNCYIRGRSTYVELREHKSKHRRVKQGVPQGGVLSLLFNYYMSKMPVTTRQIIF